MTGRDVRSIATGTPLEALRAHSSMLRSPHGAAFGESALRALVRSGDRLGRALAIRPLAAVAGPDLDLPLAELARSDDPLSREQAVWALGDRPATREGIGAAVAAVEGGGHAAVVAQITLERWRDASDAVVASVASRLETVGCEAGRARLAEAASIGRQPDALPLLARLLRATDENDAVRAAAARGLAARPSAWLLDDLWRAAGEGSAELRYSCVRALLALRTARAGEAAAVIATAAVRSDEPFDRLLVAVVRGRERRAHDPRGLRLAQIFVQGRLDTELAHAGSGDGGGISTLLVHLGGALGRRPEVGSVTTIARALAEPETGWRHVALSEPQAPGVSIERIPFGPAGYVPAPDLWSHRLELERSLETVIREIGGVDVAHLRFADAGAFAAARVCRRLGIPVAFTAAPDPHAVIASAVASGHLDRESFPAAELREHYLQRAQLVETLLGQAGAVVVLPRPGARSALAQLIGKPFLEVADSRVATIPEGISLEEIDDARAQLDAARAEEGPLPAAAEDLLDHVASLPAARRGLPLLLGVGRLHRVKGLALLVEAWAGDDGLQRAFNLVLVGGNLVHPTPEERAVLAEIEDVCEQLPQAREGLVLLGHRPNGSVATIMQTTASGLGDLIGSDGIYACTSRKEEFGVALLEAMATGLAVVAPVAGGPATYIEDGETGFLADTSSLDSVRDALRRAAASRGDRQRARRAGDVVRSGYTIEAMAGSLAEVYESALREDEQVAA